MPAFSHTVQVPFPSVGAITSSTDVSKAGYTLSVASVSNADSVYFQVGSVVKALAGNASSCEFSASELSSLGTGQSIIQVAPIRMTNAQYGGKHSILSTKPPFRQAQLLPTNQFVFILSVKRLLALC